MSSRSFDPTRLDVQAFAVEGGVLAGRWPLRNFVRVAELAADESDESAAVAEDESTLATRVGSTAADGKGSTGARADNEVAWAAEGESRPVHGASPQVWLHLTAEAAVSLQCQRCLAAVSVPVEVRRSFRFVPGEDAAAQLDAASEEDVLALTRALDLHELIEDELLLAMPLVPLHTLCPTPLPIPPADDISDERPNPFAVLAGLRREGPVN
jgi:uncharacterized protein